MRVRPRTCVVAKWPAAGATWPALASGRSAIVCPPVPAPILASSLFGRPVVIDGASERLRDLGVVREGESWRVVAVRSHGRTAAFSAWVDGGITATAEAGAIEATWLREALFDRQIVDLAGRRVTRVGDVVLRADGERLEVAAVEVGAAAVLRRLGFARLARRLEPRLLGIDRLHLAGEAAGALLLDAPRRRLEELDSDTVAELLSRLPVAAAETTVRRSRHRDAVARHASRRRLRRRYPRTPG
jgi:hypothetical protein